MLLSHYQNASQNPDIKTANRAFENMAQFIHIFGRNSNKSEFYSGRKYDEIKFG
jgi:hypothetical protein